MQPFKLAAHDLDDLVAAADPRPALPPALAALPPRAVPARDTRAAVSRRTIRGALTQTYVVTFAVLALGITSIAMLAWANTIHNRAYEYFVLVDAIMDLQTRTAKSYALLADDRPVNPHDLWFHLDRAISLCEALLHGGKSVHEDAVILPLSEPHLRALAGHIMGKLTELKVIAQNRIENPGAVVVWRPADVFGTVLDNVELLAMTIEKNHLIDQAKSRRLFVGIVLAWSCVLVASTAGLWSRERRRRVADMALRKANADLGRQTEDLRRHREHLMEFVEERTTGLRTAIVRLQQEVVEREEAEEALRKSEEQYRMLVDTMNEGLVVADGNGILTYVNDKFCELLGYGRDELLGRASADLLSEADQAIITEHIHAARSADHTEVTFKRKNGEPVFTIVSPRAIRDGDGKVVGGFAVITDITEKVALQADSMRTAHLVSLGEVAAGVAHEINNPINGIINYARILCNECPRDGRAHDIAARIVKEGRRIANTVRDLLLFARGGTSDKKLVHLRDILGDALGLVGSDMKQEGIQIVTSIPADLPRIIGDPHGIQQVFMNTISNARYALNQKYPGLHDDKRLRISAEPVVAETGAYVRVAFHDRGVGIPAGIIDKIREPFFSTKPRGKGTGLGLSITDGIIRDHGGKLTIESSEGEFTSVIIDLPAGETV
jgi:PAS domain S-box-containing protein